MMTVEEFGNYSLGLKNNLRLTIDGEGLKLIYDDNEVDSMNIYANTTLENVKHFVFKKELEEMQRRGNFSIEEMRTFFMKEFNK